MIRPKQSVFGRALHLGVTALFAAALTFGPVFDVYAKSSGGYSKPSSSSSSRTPSVSSSPSRSYSAPSPSYSAPSRTPSTSGGYGKADSGSSGGGWGSMFGGSSRTAAPPAVQSSGDRAMSGQGSGSALQQMREQERARTAPPPSAAPPSGSRDFATTPTPPRPEPRRDYRDYDRRDYGGGYYGGYGSRAPSTYYGGSPGYAQPQMMPGSNFSMLDAGMLYLLLSNLNQPRVADYMHNQRDNPSFQAWKSQVENLSKSNDTLKERLAKLETELKEREGKPVDPTVAPPEVPAPTRTARAPSVVSDAPEVITTPAVASTASNKEKPVSSGMGIIGWLFVLAIIGAIAFGGWYMLIGRNRAQRNRPATSSADRVASGLNQAERIMEQRGKTYRPDYYRIGMTVASDPTPFILAGDTIKVPQPQDVGGSVSVMAISTLTSGGMVGATELTRLYLDSEKRKFYQLHLGADGKPDECRYFEVIDEVHPADAEEWKFWLAKEDGSIGLGEFQTKDGKLYQRLWSPSSARSEPRKMQESFDGAKMELRTLSMMLYAAPIEGAVDPAPTQEYILLSAVEQGSSARVEIAAGIDINPTTLNLA